tara:strand:+ start:442 stop:810 length:369 start_codon:yes stop_codon:yes gene_type:complete
MPKYKIISTGKPIVADLAFVEEHYPGDFEEIVSNDPVKTHVKVFRAAEFRDSFTTAEKIAVLSSSNATLKVIWEILQSSTKLVDISSTEYTTFVPLLEAEGVIDEALRDSYLQGIPVDRMPK